MSSRDIPPKEHTLRYATALGIDIPEDATDGQVRDLIRAAPVTDEQRAVAAELEVEVTDSDGYDSLNRRLVQRKRKLARDALSNPHVRVKNTIIYDGNAYTIMQIYPERSRVYIKPFFEGPGMGSPKTALGLYRLAKVRTATAEDMRAVSPMGRAQSGCKG